MGAIYGIDAAHGITRNYQREISRVQDDRDLSPEGKKNQLAAVYTKYSAQMEELRERAAEARQEDISRSSKAVWGIEDLYPYSHDHSQVQRDYRDAVDRAAKLTNQDQISQALQSAERVGDTALARAYAARAVEVGATDVIEDYAQRHPKWKHSLEEYRSVLPSSEDQFSQKLVFFLNPPKELGRKPARVGI